jgi:uncharacterized RDD family membrane protein YckC
MFIFRSFNEIAYSFFGLIFYLIPIVIYLLLIIKSKNYPLPEGYASFEKRAIAIGIDTALIYGINYSLLYFYAGTPEPPVFKIALITMATSFANLIILPTFTGWSIGKKILKIKIIRKENKEAGFGEIFTRELVKSWFSMLIFYLGCFWFLTSKRTTWHDSVADTIVVNENFAIEEAS